MIDLADTRSLSDRRADATRAAVVEAAWALSRQKGIVGWSLREVAHVVGLKAPTLYAYFDNKHAIYDAMFHQGYEEMDALAATWIVDGERESMRSSFLAFFDFCTSDPTRYQLMFQRVVPSFEPSESAYAASQRLYGRLVAVMAGVGVTDPADLDLLTAILSGLTAQQLSNDPGGDRWRRLVVPALDLFLDHAHAPHHTKENDHP